MCRANGEQRDIERENAERRRLVPFHLHINVDLVESCHLLSAVLLEAAVPEGGEIVSRAFRRMLSNAGARLCVALRWTDGEAGHRAANVHGAAGEREGAHSGVLRGASRGRLGARDVARRRAVGVGGAPLGLESWELTRRHTQLMPNPAAVKDMLRSKIKSESLRTYLLANARHYESLSLGLLREMFALDDKEVKRVVARMILSRELAASWNGDNLVMLLAVPSSLQVRLAVLRRLTLQTVAERAVLGQAAQARGVQRALARPPHRRRRARTRGLLLLGNN